MENFFIWLSEQLYILKALMLILIASLQNISFTLVSRSRNRSNRTYHIIASILSNGMYYFVFKFLMSNSFPTNLIIPYIIGTVFGSDLGRSISMLIERKLDASADSHLKQYEGRPKPGVKMKE